MAVASPSFVMLGPPASGKGTQGRLLAERKGLSYLSTGSQLRREVAEETSVGKRAKPFLEEHQYVPDELANEMVAGWLRLNPTDWLLDGFPRSTPQAIELLHLAQVPITVIQLEVAEKELQRRVSKRRECPSCGAVSTDAKEFCDKCGADLVARADDSLLGFQERLQAYRELTLPALEELEKRCRVLKIDGSGSREAVTDRINTALD